MTDNHAIPDITEVTYVSDELVDALAHLLPQLTAKAPKLDKVDVKALLDDPATTLLAARLDGVIVGVLTLVHYRLLTGMRAWIEDVVVDRHARGLGIAELLTRTALDHAARFGATQVDLTSNPARLAAHRLYERVGFSPRTTTVFRIEL
jgi:GNAT superfamily N-acetyltransferase